MAEPMNREQLGQLVARCLKEQDHIGGVPEMHATLAEQAQFMLAVIDESARCINELEQTGDAMMRELHKVGYGSCGPVKKWKGAKG